MITRDSILKGREARHEKNDCAVRAIAVATGVGYERAHKALSMFGRKYRQGATPDAMDKALNYLGFSRVVTTVKAKTLISLRSTHELQTEGSFIVITTNHAVGIVDRAFLDFGQPGRQRILEVWKIVSRKPATN